MAITRIGVLRGGPSAEYDVSLQSGAAVLSALRERLADKYVPVDIFIDTSGVWHIDGAPVRPHEAFGRVDAVFNALHGAYGEDGGVQRILEAHGVPFTGSSALASAVSMNKSLAKGVAARRGIKTPYWKELSSKEILDDPEAAAAGLFRTFLMPAVVKPAGAGSSIGVSVVKDHSRLRPALEAAAAHGDAVVIEEFIPGIEATCGVVEGFRGQPLYALPPIEIRPKAGFFDYEAKYAGKSEEIVPASFSEGLKREIERLAAAAHEALGLRHYSRSDFIIHPRRGVYFLETNALPGLTGESLVPKALRAVGSGTHELVDHLVRLALDGR
ncbi:MAG: D-alanine--D-alanine ligase [Patescibacteria group bacterium]|nr:D-alanine--D-alanine ligase [Patescibacteria group bacterium]